MISLKNKFIKWPNSIEKDIMSDFMKEHYGLKGAVGIIDGTHVNFEQRPAIDGECWWTRKSKYSINVQIISNHKRQILMCNIGWFFILIKNRPGSVHDRTVFQSMKIFNNPSNYFKEEEYLLGIKYLNTKEILRMVYPLI